MPKFGLLASAKILKNKLAFSAAKKTPQLCFIGGIACMIGAGYFMWNAKDECEEILKEYKEHMAHLKELQELVEKGEIDPGEVTPKKITIEKRHYGMKAAVKFAMTLGKIVVLATGSIVFFSKGIGFYKGMAAGSAALCKQQAAYIKELEEKAGPEKVEEIKQEALERHKENPKGPINIPKTFVFDEKSKEFIPGNGFANKNLIKTIWNATQDKVDLGAAIPGNEVIQEFDIWTGSDSFKGTKSGQIYGFPPHSKVDFGVDLGRPDEDFAYSVPITFNWADHPVLSDDIPD